MGKYIVSDEKTTFISNCDVASVPDPFPRIVLNGYQNELPKKIKSRGKDAHLNHEELVQLMKWKQSRGKFFPQLSYLVKVNTPRAVIAETKKAFKKLPNLEQAITALSNLKGVGTTMASALLAAAAPDKAPFMADECLMAIPEIEGIDYTTKEYLNFVTHIQNTVERLNKEVKIESWSPHTVELALWTHYVASELKPELLDCIPPKTTQPSTENGATETVHQNGVVTSSALNTPTSQDTDQCSDESNLEATNGKSSERSPLPEETSTTSFTEDSCDKPTTPIIGLDSPSTCGLEEEEETNDSLITSDVINEDANQEPPIKKLKVDNNESKENTNDKTSDLENTSGDAASS
ncbi:unnamed protein product [Bemisia tabaci]|uniref:Uncharacterized protein n=1 Tax=Bemisia tabaci TaxID=7038 RepID=A0A9N9ZYZ0_BEMTA|nr:unnamed protein product [Bemisia tabaci]